MGILSRLSDRFHTFMDHTAPVDPPWARDLTPSQLDRLGLVITREDDEDRPLGEVPAFPPHVAWRDGELVCTECGRPMAVHP